VARSGLKLLGSSDPPASASQSAGIIAHFTARLSGSFFLEMESRSVAQAGMQCWSEMIHPPQPPKVLGLQV
uniref:Uncharacterized protein n=1 Tax=Macaca fascicularis TaxID=9541 RepID=A0A7N9CUE4_MACFA